MSPITSVIKLHQDTKYSNSNSNSNINNIKYSNSNSIVTVSQVLHNLSDLIPNQTYIPFYVSQYRKLGYTRFVELANKARAGRSPARLFAWMLKNPEIVQ